MNKLGYILKYIGYMILLTGAIYGFTLLPSNLLLIVLSGIQLTTLFFVIERLKSLKQGMQDLMNMQNKSTDHLAQNQEQLQTEIRSLRE